MPIRISSIFPVPRVTGRTLLVASLVIALFAGGVAWAQTIPTATLSGRVHNDATDLPGVTVTAKSPNLQGTRSTVTGASGDYVLANLPPGEYAVSFEMQGFRKQTKSITLGASRSDRLDVNLSMTVEATTTVTAQSDAISQSTTRTLAAGSSLEMWMAPQPVRFSTLSLPKNRH